MVGENREKSFYYGRLRGKDTRFVVLLEESLLIKFMLLKILEAGFEVRDQVAEH